MPAILAAPVRLLAIASAVPPHLLPQHKVIDAARAILGPRFAQFERLIPAFRNGGIEERRSVVPLDWFTTPRGWRDRTEAYLSGASDLFRQAAGRALEMAGLTAPEVDVIVTISSTGIATPTLEAQVAREMGFRADAIRVPVFGLGCAGGASGLGIARDLAAARPGANVLLVAVETCTLLFRLDRLRKADIIATALFGDGAAALVLRAGEARDDGRPEIGTGRQHMWPDTLDIMGWSVEENGLGVIFDRSIPDFATRELRPALDALIPGHAPQRYVCHPGGAKVLVALEQALDLPEGALDAERAVLARTGNMSAPTVLFVLEQVLASDQRGDLLVLALGPGFTLSAVPILVP
ncbi:MAG: type III polyketide synthase [Paracoccus sp.]|uniref:type III polyketide synthase n=1 Tax=unclassified Paracoccus (in: a-proteobacteria) TaxID=2688777 RepID=UPI000C60D17E|nr:MULTISPECIES: type III polyketide synthase [unclassified Paracoccus (in: a-proteobacteria)]MAN57954.1 type III polyketide synthase [Paracoccus sp. (in: a-proteobacteria)]MBA47483.1 type III polyketide synthase [Paracoccus sp. (in: a-proteobacteria)]|tara:strand:- start:151 stop:1206 length:1056 start_codon:yes stop_codon:yes gene_type:complete